MPNVYYMTTWNGGLLFMLRTLLSIQTYIVKRNDNIQAVEIFELLTNSSV